jgi:hypothetical protein
VGQKMDEDDVRDMLISPFYAINIEPELALEHEPLVSEAQWVGANLKLIDEIGAQEWLEPLLAVLKKEPACRPPPGLSGSVP